MAQMRLHHSIGYDHIYTRAFAKRELKCLSRDCKNVSKQLLVVVDQMLNPKFENLGKSSQIPESETIKLKYVSSHHDR